MGKRNKLLITQMRSMFRRKTNKWANVSLLS